MSMYSHPIAQHGAQIQRAQSLAEAQMGSLVPLIPQHMREFFSGDVVDSMWNKVLSSGASCDIDTAIDGGVILKTGTVSSGSIFSIMNYNTKRHYSINGSAIQANFRMENDLSPGRIRFMLAREMTVGAITNIFGVYWANGVHTFYQLGTRDDSVSAEVATSVTPTLNVWETMKSQIFASHVSLYMGGNFEAVSTSNLPETDGMMVGVEIWKTDNASNIQVRTNWIEAWNT